ncbi:MAG: D-alanyl-D-alanine carboxypeptidase family protein [Ruminococcaceae bacterium]|nr:D-alanyl-D-alanine carboxypeptidase family protein [Oscillospiraceae bacterium]
MDTNNRKKIRKVKIKTLLLIVILALAVLAGLFAYRHRGRIAYEWYLIEEKYGFGLDEVTVAKADGEALVHYSMEELQGDDRVVFDQSMMLINIEYMLSESFAPLISEYKDTDVYMNDCMQSAYSALSSAVLAKTEKKLYVSSHFRTADKQASLYEEMPDTATIPGASEHQSGLCVDVYVAYYAGDHFIRSDAGRFVARNAHKYGFIIRYPRYGEKVTGIRYEPWHVRYVGHPHADIIYNNRLTLEEYILGMQEGSWYTANGYCFSRQNVTEEGGLYLPAEFKEAVISPDNTGSYIVTVK